MDEKKKILIVDDNDLVRGTIKRVVQYLFNEFFSKNNFEIVEAVDGEKALEYFSGNNGSIDILLTDIRMPRMNGTTLLTKLHTEGYPLPKTIGIISGTVGDVGEINLPEEYYHFILPKPFLVEKLKDLFKKHYFK